MERLCGKSNLPMPKLYVIPEAAPNAFATGRNPKHASVAVTQGLLELMNDDELEGVIAHELSHVRNYDILITSVAAMVAGAITRARARGAMGFHVRRVRRGRRPAGSRKRAEHVPDDYPGAHRRADLQLGLSRQREYAADAAGVRLAGHPYGLISALKKLGAYNQRIPMNVPPATSSLFIVTPLSARTMMSGLFSTHPPLADRIAALEQMTVVPH